MKKHLRQWLALLLAFAMILSSASPAAKIKAEPEDAQPEVTENDVQELELEDLDPTTLHVQKLGEVEDEIPMEEAQLEDLNALVRVSIFLEEDSAIDAGYSTEGVGTNSSAISYRSQLESRQKSLTSKIEGTVGYDINVKWNLTLLVNAISAYVKVKDIPAIEKMAGVKSVERENQYEAMTGEASPMTANTSNYMVGAQAAWADGYTGAGSRIAIIDTGLDTSHQSFAADAFNYAINEAGASSELMTSAQITALKNSLNSKTTNYISAKIPYGYNYVDGNTTVTHLNDTQGEHGSHVAGIAAANRYIKSGSSYVDAAESVKAVGMAPDAQLFIMKVFGSSGGAYDSDYFAAIEDAIVLQCDAANLSLGSSVQGWTYGNSYQDILNNLTNAEQNPGLVTSISAGNSYALTAFLNTDLYIDDVSMYTGGSPGSFINSMGTAAAENVGQTGTPMKYNGRNIFYNETSSTTLSSVAGTYNFVYIDAVGNTSDYSTVNSKASLSGKVVIVNRGELSFYEKGNNAKSYSPKALIVANNQAGSISMDLSDFTGSFPMVSIMLADAEYIKANATKATTGGITYYTGSITITNTLVSGQTTNREDAEITDFSSWGVPGSLLMKPEITAPGGDIYSVWGANQGSSTPTEEHDAYELMSGTSMAAPHIAGLTGVLAEYVREANVTVDGYSRRAVLQSLLMSTATPMKNNGHYLSILQQGAGLVEVSKAIEASSVLMIDEGVLTTSTGAAADGKVKVEFGDDPKKSGTYTYSFTLYNLTDTDLEFDLKTDLFTQDHYTDDGAVFMDQATTDLAANVSYDWETIGEGPAETHDVNKDGKTNEADAQAILDYLSGKNDGSALSLTDGEMDNDGKLTTQDAQLLLTWEDSGSGSVEDGIVPANGKRSVEVTIQLTDAQKEALDAIYTSGAYIEGFTYATCTSTTAEGKSLAHEHSIPLLGFYGSWTDPSMFDNTSYVDTIYGTEKTPYTGNTDTNYMKITSNGTTAKFSGNPYMVESTFPAERLAINSNATIASITYNLVRAAGTTGFAVSKIDDYGGDVSSVLNASVTGNNVDGIWYYQSQGSWQNTGSKTYSSNKKISSYNLVDGDMVRIGFYALPEYNGMLEASDMTSADAGVLSSAGFKNVLEKNVLGDGAFIGYDFVVDNTDPELTSATLSGNNLTVKASDNRSLAYVAVMSLDGSTKYSEAAPGTKDYSVTLDIANAVANAAGYVAVFVGDYAGNEAAKAVKVNNNSSTDPYKVTSVEVTPTSLDLYKGNTADVVAKVLPLTAEDRSVSWKSSNTSVATVDETGHVVAVGAGSATLTATANGDTSKTATCSVKVTSVNKTLNAMIWDEEGGVYFSSFNANNLPNWTKLHSDSKGLELHSAVYQNNRLYAATLDTSTGTSTLYTVNTCTYALTEVGEMSFFAVDMAPTSASTTIVQPYAYYLMATSLSSPNSSSNPSVYKDMSSYLGDDVYIAGVAARVRGSSYYFLDENGVIWQCSYSTRQFGTPTKVLETGISTSFLYQSLYYDGTYLYWAHQTDNEAELIIINPSTKAVYHAGNFGEGVWPAAGLYVNGSVAPAGSDSEIEEDTSVQEETQPIAAIDELEKADIMAGFYAEAATFAEKQIVEAPTEEEPEYAGGLNAVRISENTNAARKNDRLTTGTSETDETGTVTITISEEEDVVNGLYSIDYDPDSLEYVSFSPLAAEYSSCYNDEKGVVTIAFANKKAITAGNDIAQIVFKVLSCEDIKAEDEVFGFSTLERNADLDLNEYEALSATGIGHDWAEATYTWAEDNSIVTASRVCKNDETHVETETVNTTYAVVKEATDEEAGVGRYTATFTNPAFATQTKDIELPRTGYQISYTWADDNSEVTATAVPNAGGTPIVETVKTTSEVTKPATCEEMGETTYTAVFANPLFATQTKVVENVPALGHDWGEPTYEWAADNSKVTATAICKNDASHKVTETVNTTYAVTKKATCEAAGEGTYTATFKNALFSTQTKKVVIPATGHEWNAPTYEWSETSTGYDVTAKRICKNDASHVETETKTATYAVITPATETESGLGRYTVIFDNPAFTQQTKDVVIQPTGYEITYTWSSDNSQVTATAVPYAQGAETITETVNTTSEITKPATCEEMGETTYTAVFTNSLFATQTKVVENVPALGHDWGEPTYEWSTDNSKVTVTAVCGNDTSHKVTETTNTSYEVTKKATCEAAGEGTYTATFKNALFSTQTKKVAIPATGHDWNAPTYEWSADNKTVTAKRTCKSDASHVETETVNTTSKVTKAATCEAKGETTYTATFTNSAFATQTKTVTDIPATGHDWNAPTYEWSADNKTVTATRTCKNDASHVETETVNTTSKQTKAPTCEAKGETTYTATFTNAAFVTQTKVVDNIPALGHDWNAPTYEWSADNKTVTAKRTCKNDASHVETETVNTTSVITKPATCEAKGETTYTATFTNNAFVTQTKTVEDIPAIGHSYKLEHWDWAEDYSEATAVFVCEYDKSHTKNVSGEIIAVSGDNTISYTAKVTFEGKSYEDSKEIIAVKVLTRSLNLEGKIQLFFYLSIPEQIRSDSNAYIEMSFNGTTENVLLKDLANVPKGDLTNRYRLVKDVYAKQMRDVVTFKVFDENHHVIGIIGPKGEVVGTKGYSFSVQDYIDLAKAANIKNLEGLVTAMEHYGDAAQLVLDYEQDGIQMAEEVNEVTLKDIDAFAPQYSGTLPVGIKDDTSSLVLESDNTLRQYYVLNADAEITDYTFSVDGKTVTPLKETSTGRYYLQVQNIPAKELHESHVLKVTDGKNTYTITHSALGYSYKALTKSTDEELIYFAKALYLYNKAARTFFNY